MRQLLVFKGIFDFQPPKRSILLCTTVQPAGKVRNSDLDSKLKRGTSM